MTTDVTIGQASATFELKRANPGLNREQLFRHGMVIGRDHIASMVNTLMMAYVGAALPLFPAAGWGNCMSSTCHRVRHYEISQGDHAHRVCLGCGRIEDIPGDFEKLKSLFQWSDGSRAVRCAVTIYGYCEDYVLSLEAEE